MMMAAPKSPVVDRTGPDPGSRIADADRGSGPLKVRSRGEDRDGEGEEAGEADAPRHRARRLRHAVAQDDVDDGVHVPRRHKDVDRARGPGRRREAAPREREAEEHKVRLVVVRVLDRPAQAACAVRRPVVEGPTQAPLRNSLDRCDRRAERAERKLEEDEDGPRESEVLLPRARAARREVARYETAPHGQDVQRDHLEREPRGRFAQRVVEFRGHRRRERSAGVFGISASCDDVVSDTSVVSE
eukprot:CAMPEP_0185694004 /NCGR_PEP_ID=MMETSP1164-20130828/3620_1 /TAXON_ID=1104430 /ORGANISM="Chrysoreinhardia sp, Strain CCMP2950" /LENGTH=243 /DNA_ID=CAMNT_0028360825 /DNA_START=306 /DNA_END=1037 /DNA_ORIENTATION=+